MATVPRYSGAQVSEQTLPGVRISDQGATPEAFGAGIAQGIGAFAGVAKQIHEREQAKADTAAQMEIENQLAGLENATVYDPESGLLNKQGKDAIGLHEQFQPAWEQGASDIIGRAPRRLQQWAVQQAQRRHEGANRILMRHSAAEADKYYVQQADALVANASNDAVLNYLDPARVDEEIGRGMIAADRRADLMGADELTRARLRTETASAIQRAVVERMIVDDPNAALDRLAQVRDRLTGADQTKLEAVLRPVLTDANADAWLKANMAGGSLPAGAIPVEGAAKTEAEAEAIARASVGRTVGLESGGKADAKNPNSSATGAAQFIDATWLDVVKRTRPDLAAGKSRAEILALRNDPKLSKDMAEAYAVENCKGLFDSGLPVTVETAYLCHRFGLDGARKLLRADPDTPVSAIVGAAAMAANPDLKGKTVAELSASHAHRAGEATAVVPAAVAADGKPDWADLLRRAQAIPNPQLRDRATAKVERQRSIATLAEAETTRAMTDRTYTAVEQADPSTPLEKVIGPEAMAWARKEGHVAALEARLRQRLNGELVQSDPKLVDAYAREAVLSPDSFLKRNIQAQSTRLASDDLTRLLKLQADMRDPSKRDKARADWATDNERIESGLRLLGFESVRGKPAVHETERGQFRLFYHQAETAFMQRTGAKPTPEQADKLLREVVQRAAARPELLHAAQAAETFGLGGEVKGANGPVRLTEADRATVRAVLRERGITNPTDAQVLAAAGAYYSKGQ